MPPAKFSPAILLLLILTLSCGGGRTPDTGADPASADQPRARIENRSSIDMDVYLIRNDRQSIRLGFLPGGESATFPLAATAGTPFVTFEARPVRRSGQTIRSEPFSLQTGEEIFWSISPQ